jgi:hypothetical protein
MASAARGFTATLLKKNAKNTLSGLLGLPPANGNVMMSANF